MINRNNSSMFRFFLIFSMNFAWVANVFGFIGSKKEQFSVKRVTKAINNSDLLKKNHLTQVFQFKKFETADFAETILHPSHTALIPAKYLNIDFNPGHNLISGIKKQMLFPHHGFW